MTNYEKIKSMSVEELAKFIDNIAVCCFKLQIAKIVRFIVVEMKSTATVQL